MPSDLTDCAAVVTGGSKGYGEGIAARLRKAGAQVWITARHEEELAAAAERTGAHPIVADVTSPDDWDKLVDEVVTTAGRMDVLVNNAGAGIRIAPLAEQTDEEIARSIAVNLTGAIYGCRRAAKIMGEQGSGTIVNVSSVCARQGWPGFAVYSAAKAGMGLLSDCLYAELREKGVRVTTLIPSWGATDFAPSAGLPAKSPEDAARCIQPEELGKIVVDIATLPEHLAIQDLTVWPRIQEVVPL